MMKYALVPTEIGKCYDAFALARYSAVSTIPAKRAVDRKSVV